MNSAAIYKGLEISLWNADSFSFGFISNNEIIKSYGSFVFNILRSLHIFSICSFLPAICRVLISLQPNLFSKSLKNNSFFENFIHVYNIF